jgi:hypothetical protein
VQEQTSILIFSLSFCTNKTVYIYTFYVILSKFIVFRERNVNVEVGEYNRNTHVTPGDGGAHHYRLKMLSLPQILYLLLCTPERRVKKILTSLSNEYLFVFPNAFPVILCYMSGLCAVYFFLSFIFVANDDEKEMEMMELMRVLLFPVPPTKQKENGNLCICACMQHIYTHTHT